VAVEAALAEILVVLEGQEHEAASRSARARLDDLRAGAALLQLRAVPLHDGGDARIEVGPAHLLEASEMDDDEVGVGDVGDAVRRARDPHEGRDGEGQGDAVRRGRHACEGDGDAGPPRLRKKRLVDGGFRVIGDARGRGRAGRQRKPAESEGAESLACHASSPFETAAGSLSPSSP
jgi:hypothetical protein